MGFELPVSSSGKNRRPKVGVGGPPLGVCLVRGRRGGGSGRGLSMLRLGKQSLSSRSCNLLLSEGQVSISLEIPVSVVVTWILFYSRLKLAKAK